MPGTHQSGCSERNSRIFVLLRVACIRNCSLCFVAPTRVAEPAVPTPQPAKRPLARPSSRPLAQPFKRPRPTKASAHSLLRPLVQPVIQTPSVGILHATFNTSFVCSQILLADVYFHR